MRIYRGDQSVDGLASQADDCIESWKNGEPFALEIDSLSQITLEITDADIITLFYALIQGYEYPPSRGRGIKLCTEAMARLAAYLLPKPRDCKTPVTDLEIGYRAKDCLTNLNIRTISDLVQLREGELYKEKHFGAKSMDEIKDALTALGLTLKPEEAGHNDH